VRAGKIALVVAGAVALLVGFGLSGVGGALLWANATQRDANGYFTSPTETFRTAGHALTSSVDFGVRPGPNDWAPYRPLGTIRIRATLAGATTTFVGIAPTGQVDRYLADVAHDQVVGATLLPFRPHYRNVPGNRSPASPVGQGFWTASATGTGTQTATWTTQPGRWTVVVMRADAGPGIVAHVSVGAKAWWVLPLGVGLTIGGVVVLAGGVVMLAVGVVGLERTRREDEQPPGEPGVAVGHAQPGPPPGDGVTAAYPARPDG
jgi:hypothetical protein